jgi:hypothetical protein
MTWTETIERYLREGRSVSGGKGGDTAVGADIANENNFMGTLRKAFSTQFANQQSVLNFLNGKFQSMAANPYSSSPAISGSIQQSAVDTQNAQKAAQAAIAARGGSTLPSGVNAQIEGQIAASGANEESALTTQAAQQNYWNALNGEQAVAQMENPLGYGSEVNQGSGVIGSLDQTYQNSRTLNAERGPSGMFGGAISGALQGGMAALGV